jgi:hypothetical protein
VGRRVMEEAPNKRGPVESKVYREGLLCASGAGPVPFCVKSREVRFALNRMTRKMT